MSQTAHAWGIAGKMINGACRDVAVADATGYAIWSTARFMRTGKDRVRVGSSSHAD
jgi:regulator of RNase E activity RraA